MPCLFNSFVRSQDQLHSHIQVQGECVELLQRRWWEMLMWRHLLYGLMPPCGIYSFHYSGSFTKDHCAHTSYGGSVSPNTVVGSHKVCLCISTPSHKISKGLHGVCMGNNGLCKIVSIGWTWKYKLHSVLSGSKLYTTILFSVVSLMSVVGVVFMVDDCCA